MATVSQKRLAGLVLVACGISAAGCSVEVKPPRDTSKDIKIEGPSGSGIEIKR